MLNTIILGIVAFICTFVGFTIAASLFVAKEADRREEITVGYDKSNDNDKSCLIIAKRIDDHIFIKEEFYNQEAEAVNKVLKYFSEYYIKK